MNSMRPHILQEMLSGMNNTNSSEVDDKDGNPAAAPSSDLWPVIGVIGAIILVAGFASFLYLRWKKSQDQQDDAEGAAYKPIDPKPGFWPSQESSPIHAVGSAMGAETHQERKALMPFVIISLSYLLFTITDGSVRMIVLLHAYNKNFTAMEVAVMFTLYETAGVVTNLLAGIAGAKWGIKWTLLVGLSLQFGGLGMLFGWQDSWCKGVAILYVTIAGMLCGIAKDLTKLGGKTVTRLVTPEEKQGKLFVLVSWITGFKNSLKGVGYFIGAACIAANDEWGYYLALGVNVLLVALAIPWAAVGLSDELGTAKSKNVTLHEALFNSNHNLNWLSLARLFLFASRDFWFEVPLPFYLRSPPCESIGLPCGGGATCPDGTECDAQIALCRNINDGGGCGGFALSRVVAGAVLAGYIILYGQMQAFTPQLVLNPLKQSPPNKYGAILWGYIACAPPMFLGVIVHAVPALRAADDGAEMIAYLVLGITAFAIVFAINSSIHSYLVVRYAEGNKVAQSVGFYYMSNAAGRLLGTLVSGALYTYVGYEHGQSDVNKGMAACFLAGTISMLLATLITYRINDDQAGLACGGCCMCVDGEMEEPDAKPGDE